MERSVLLNYLDQYLNLNEIDDYGPQGLQVEADNDEIERVALAVDAAPPVIGAASEWRADLLLVHHGILWRSVERIAGPLGQRVRLLLAKRINLYAAHLALDAHQEIGNNAVLAKMFGLRLEQWWFAPTGTDIGVYGQLTEPRPVTRLADEVADQLGTTVRTVDHGPEVVERLAIISGAAAEQAGAARALGADTFLTGETSHAHFWDARDYGLNVIYAGHYATETVGVKALGRHLGQRFGLETKFFDFPTGM